jgi:hypothetical protein
MKIGTKSLLFGVHQFFWHPLTVYRAWKRLYGRPSLRESVCSFVHDWGYWRAADIDGSMGRLHPESGARIIGLLFDDTHRDLVLLHSRRYAKARGAEPSKLCWADKLSIMYDPEWFYLLRARASGELDEYRNQAAAHIQVQQSDRAWLRWMKRRFAKSALLKSRSTRTRRPSFGKTRAESLVFARPSRRGATVE